MGGKKLRILISAMLVSVLSLQQPGSVLAQEIVTKESLDEWFYSRLLWATVAGVLIGLFIGLAHLCRMPFQYNGALNINSRARRGFLAWAGAIFVVTAVLLLLDVWLLYPFGTISLSFWEAVTQIWSNYRMLLILFAVLIAFFLVVAIVTRLKSDCRCRYAFIPGPQGK